MKLFQCFVVCRLVYKANSVQQQLIFFQILLEMNGKFKAMIRTTQKAGRLCRTLLTLVNVIVSQWEVTRYIEQVN
jgi:hypothetical protein